MGEALDRHQLRQMVATEAGAPLHDVEMMEGRLAASGFSLKAAQSAEDEGREWIDALEDEGAQAAAFGKVRKTVEAQLTGERLFLAV